MGGGAQQGYHASQGNEDQRQVKDSFFMGYASPGKDSAISPHLMPFGGFQ